MHYCTKMLLLGHLIVTLLFHVIFYLQAFSFLSLFLFIGMLGYFFAARYALKWPSHGEDPPKKEGYEQTDDLAE